ncbi:MULTISPECIES: hypothetical protein [unclassified Frankia]|uniref:hypothetical protein n=1 Tax=unclassified Frankia TaxID=2632575 RepID=UPI002AD3D2D3|nr:MULTISPECIES: hypothetical protein [unclassified Frankia]
MIRRFCEAYPHLLRWVAGDEVYGGSPTLRAWLKKNQVGYQLRELGVRLRQRLLGVREPLADLGQLLAQRDDQHRELVIRWRRWPGPGRNMINM